MNTETREWNIECFGKKLGILKVTNDPHQKEIILIFEIKSSPDLEVRTSSSSPEDVQFTFKEKEVIS